MTTDSNAPTDSDAVASVRLERTFDATPEVVWAMWTDPAHFAAWYGPTGATIPVIEMDVRVGGRRHFRMDVATPDGAHQMWMVGEYTTVEPTTVLAYTESMSNEAGDVVSPAAMGMPEGHPAVTEVTVEIGASGAGSNVVVTHAGIPAGSPGEMGWSMALDDLAARIAEHAG